MVTHLSTREKVSWKSMPFTFNNQLNFEFCIIVLSIFDYEIIS